MRAPSKARGPVARPSASRWPVTDEGEEEGVPQGSWRGALHVGDASMAGPHATAYYGPAWSVADSLGDEDAWRLADHVRDYGSWRVAYIVDVSAGEARRTGAGTSLVTRLLDELAARDTKEVFLHAVPGEGTSLAQLRRFYRRFGFETLRLPRGDWPAMRLRMEDRRVPALREVAPARARSLARRGNPDESDAPFVLLTQRPHPEQPWLPQGEFAELEGALDEATFQAREPGTVVRVDREDEVVWLGVVDGRGRRREALPLPFDAPQGSASWVEAWEGGRTGADWLLAQCLGCPGDRVLLAACACARETVRRMPPMRTSARPDQAREALNTVEAWADGQPVEELDYGLRWALSAAERAPQRSPDDFRSSEVSDLYVLTAMAVASACRAAVVLADSAPVYTPTVSSQGFPAGFFSLPRSPQGLVARGSTVDAASEAALRSARALAGVGANWEAIRTATARLAPVVRRYLSLGMVLRARIEGLDD